MGPKAPGRPEGLVAPRYEPASFLANLIAGRTPFEARSALTRAFCRGFRVRKWPMYRPWSLSAARRADDSLSLRPRRRSDGFSEWCVAAASAGPRRTSAREIVASDFRMARTSLLTDRRRVLGKRTSS